MEQTKALNALEPFILLSKSAIGPRAAADLVTRATSAPNTFLFAELLQSPQIQALGSSPEYAPHLRLLQIFSYGSYESYLADATLPALTEPQTLKLRQLSLLSLAGDRSALSYDSLQHALGLSCAREVEELVVTAVYAGLLHATLDPARQAVRVTSVSPLRDLAPGAVPNMVAALQGWASRCSSTLTDLEAQIAEIRSAAGPRQREMIAREERMDRILDMARAAEAKTPHDREALARRGFNKRSMLDVVHIRNVESMDLDDVAGEDQGKRAGKRKM